jgi:photosystem II stability/assembly factor-like uncharacterized protein
VYLSSDFGITWTFLNLKGNWQDVASCADGKHYVLVDNGGFIWTSSDYGQTWSNDNNAGMNQWYSVTISDDGSKVAAGASDDDVYMSGDYGQTWAKAYASISR